MNAVDEFRSFNRFFTREIGLLDKHLLASDYTLAEGRVLYELANNGEQTAADIGRSLHMDKAHLSRIVSRFEKRKLGARSCQLNTWTAASHNADPGGPRGLFRP